MHFNLWNVPLFNSVKEYLNTMFCSGIKSFWLPRPYQYQKEEKKEKKKKK